jgi:hypothetical protein
MDAHPHSLLRAIPITQAAGGVESSSWSLADPLRRPEERIRLRPESVRHHDGGTTWDPVDVGGNVTDLAISDGEVYAIVSPPPGTAGRLMRSPVGQDEWSTVSAAGRVSGGLWVLGHEVLAQSATGPGFPPTESPWGTLAPSRRPINGSTTRPTVGRHTTSSRCTKKRPGRCSGCPASGPRGHTADLLGTRLPVVNKRETRSRTRVPETSTATGRGHPTATPAQAGGRG